MAMNNTVSWDEWLAPLRDGQWRRFSDLWRRLNRAGWADRPVPDGIITKGHFRRMLVQHGAYQAHDEVYGHETYCLHALSGKKSKATKQTKPPATHDYELAFSLPENGGCVFTSSTHHGETTVKLLCYGMPTKLKLEPMRQDSDA